MTGVFVRKVKFGNIERWRYRDWSVAATSSAMPAARKDASNIFFFRAPESCTKSPILTAFPD